MGLNAFEIKILNETQNFLKNEVKNRTKNKKLLALRDIAKKKLFRIITFISMIKARSEIPSSRDEYFKKSTGLFDEDLAKDALGALVGLRDAGINDQIIKQAIDILETFD